MSRAGAALVAGVLAIVLFSHPVHLGPAPSSPVPPDGNWVVFGGPSYSRGEDRYTVDCVLNAADPTGPGPTKTVQVTTEVALRDTDELDRGKPCPEGVLVWFTP